MLHDTLREDMQVAMREKADVRLRTLRLVLSACTNALVEAGKKPNESLDDDSVVRVLKRLVKQRQESAEQYRGAGREEQAASEDEERAVLEAYLPEELSEDEIRSVVLRVQQSSGFSEKKDTGALMKLVMQELQGKADGSLVARVVASVLA